MSHENTTILMSPLKNTYFLILENIEMEQLFLSIEYIVGWILLAEYNFDTLYLTEASKGHGGDFFLCIPSQEFCYLRKTIRISVNTQVS